jgi:hypothetical protein
MFHRITALVYGLFGALAGHKIATWGDAPTGSVLISVVVGALVALAIYYVLRFLRFAESAYRREISAAPVAPMIFKSGKDEDVPRPTFTSK